MGKQTSIFDVINESDDSIDSLLKYLNMEIKNMKYLAQCISIHEKYNPDSDKVGKINYSLKSMISAIGWACLIGFACESSKSKFSMDKYLMNNWTKKSKLNEGLSGDVLDLEKITEAVDNAESRLRSMVMSKSYDNIERVDEMRRLLLLTLDSFEEAKNGIKFVN